VHNDKSTFKVATYNIHRCIGSDELCEPQRILDVILELNADVIGIQEIDSHCITEIGHQLNFIVKRTGYHFVAGPTMFRSEKHYGNALLTRHTIKNIRNLDLSVPGLEPRGAIDVDLEIHGMNYRIITTHLGLKYRERMFQLKHLTDKIFEANEHKTILLGDFNEWLPWVGTTRILKRRFHRVPSSGTFPATKPIFRLDEIYTSMASKLKTHRVHKTKLSQMASDHLPVVAEFILRDVP